MSGTAVITDSVACTPETAVQELGIRIVPLYLMVGGTAYRDGMDIRVSQGYDMLRKGHQHRLGTSAPAPGDFLKVYEEASAESATDALVLTLSARLSAVYQSAQLAAQDAPLPDRVLDTRCAAGAQVLLVMEAARWVRQGATLAEAARRVGELRLRLHFFAYLASLDQLRRSGRISGVLARLGTMLHVTPVLTISDEGEVILAAPTRSPQRAREYLLRRLDEDSRGTLTHMIIMHASDVQGARHLLKDVAVPLAEVYISEFSPVMGIHTGPGVLGFSSWSE